ncbi:MAG: leucine-rich repeat domain-containing protein [Promethearchaeota archaeon]
MDNKRTIRLRLENGLYKPIEDVLEKLIPNLVENTHYLLELLREENSLLRTIPPPIEHVIEVCFTKGVFKPITSLHNKSLFNREGAIYHFRIAELSRELPRNHFAQKKLVDPPYPLEQDRSSFLKTRRTTPPPRKNSYEAEAPLTPTDASVLTTLEQAVGKIPQLNKHQLGSTTKGYVTENHSIIVLKISHKSLPVLPDKLGQLNHLESLFLPGCQVKTLPDSIGKLTTLKILSLSINQLRTLPETIGRLKNLTMLHLNDNQLTFLPDSIGELSALELLQLSRNQLSSLPETIGSLKNLQHLALHRTKLRTLPKTIGNLVNLRSLHVGENQLTSLPKTIKYLTNLQSLFVFSNPLVHSAREREQIAHLVPPTCQIRWVL